jgi:hypothetical protein
LELPKKVNIFELIDKHGKALLDLRLMYNGALVKFSGMYFRLTEVNEGERLSPLFPL